MLFSDTVLSRGFLIDAGIVDSVDSMTCSGKAGFSFGVWPLSAEFPGAASFPWMWLFGAGDEPSMPLGVELALGLETFFAEICERCWSEVCILSFWLVNSVLGSAAWVRGESLDFFFCSPGEFWRLVFLAIGTGEGRNATGAISDRSTSALDELFSWTFGFFGFSTFGASEVVCCAVEGIAGAGGEEFSAGFAGLGLKCRVGFTGVGGFSPVFSGGDFDSGFSGRDSGSGARGGESDWGAEGGFICLGFLGATYGSPSGVSGLYNTSVPGKTRSLRDSLVSRRESADIGLNPNPFVQVSTVAWAAGRLRTLTPICMRARVILVNNHEGNTISFNTYASPNCSLFLEEAMQSSNPFFININREADSQHVSPRTLQELELHLHVNFCSAPFVVLSEKPKAFNTSC